MLNRMTVYFPFGSKQLFGTSANRTELAHKDSPHVLLLRAIRKNPEIMDTNQFTVENFDFLMII